ncbi:MAG: hypothetical protein AAB889_04055 [Patescibacteria group bacterium]
MQYQITPESIIFLDSDILNGYSTVAYDWTSDDLFAIRPLEYKILRFIHDSQAAPFSSLKKYMSDEIDEEELKSILDILTNKKIIYVSQ